MKRTMTLAQWWRSGARQDPRTPLGMQIGAEVVASARRHVWRMYVKHHLKMRPKMRAGFLDAAHILMHAQLDGGTCSQCPAYLLRKEARRG